MMQSFSLAPSEYTDAGPKPMGVLQPIMIWHLSFALNLCLSRKPKYLALSDHCFPDLKHVFGYFLLKKAASFPEERAGTWHVNWLLT